MGATLIVDELGVSPSIIRYSFTDLGKMEGCIGLAARGEREKYCYDLHRNLNWNRLHGSTMVYPLSHGCEINIPVGTFFSKVIECLEQSIRK